MSKHTPGPWNLWTSCSWRRFGALHGGQVCVPVTQRDGHPDLHFPNGGADGPDARLIAAAPDLLEACKVASALLKGLPASLGYDYDAKQLDAAIRKAEGA